MIFIYAALGGFVGGFLRWLIAQLIPGKRATLMANTVACFVAGVVVCLELSHLYTVLLIAGFCGALSTWSTLAKEIGQLINDKKWQMALGYLSVTLILGFSAVFIGMQL
ncbi:fluoride efflux transporter FluC [Corynebacterium crudilactis]|uniref:Fluoride-specific ion channel FluC n=1 Tax=Corynebacterium crudilactis TaxID=1652495 RepID=A0A172QVT6_9CORY|nr:CrcB family protein [Corynebacterium crudilactis]ANE04748.1 chromosome condensation protein CrcB [Corynebacterium crudilactis]